MNSLIRHIILIITLLVAVSCGNEVVSNSIEINQSLLQVQVALSVGVNSSDVKTRSTNIGTPSERTMSNYYIFIYENSGSTPTADALPVYTIKSSNDFSSVVFEEDGEVKTLTTIQDDKNLLSIAQKEITVAIVANVPTRDKADAKGTYVDYLNTNNKYESLTFQEFQELYDDLEAINRLADNSNAKLIYTGLAIYNTNQGGSKTHVIPVSLVRNMARIDINLKSEMSNVAQDGMKLLDFKVRGERRYAPFYVPNENSNGILPSGVSDSEVARERSLDGQTTFYTQPTKVDGSQSIDMDFVVELNHNDGSVSYRTLSVAMVDNEGKNIILKQNYLYSIDVTFLDHNYTLNINVSGWNEGVENNWDGEVNNGEVGAISTLSLNLNRDKLYSLSPAGNLSNIVAATIQGGVPPITVEWFYKSIYDTEYKSVSRKQYNSFGTTGVINENYEHVIYDHNDIRGELYCVVKDGIDNQTKSDNIDLFVKRTFFGTSNDEYVTFQNATNYLNAEASKINSANPNRVRYLRDARDNKVYRVKLMTNNRWVMVSDLEYNNLAEKEGNSSNGYIYQGTAANYPKEGGYLYSGPRAYEISSASNLGNSDGICPDGWTLPSCADLGPWFGVTSTTGGFSNLKGELVIEYSKGYEDTNSTHFEFANVQWTGSSSTWPGNNNNDTYGHYWLKEVGKAYAFRIFSNSTSGFMNACSFTQYNALRCIKK